MHEVLVDEEAESGADKGDFLVTEVANDGFVKQDEFEVEGEDLGVRLADFLVEEVRCYGGGEGVVERVDDAGAGFGVEGEEGCCGEAFV